MVAKQIGRRSDEKGKRWNKAKGQYTYWIWKTRKKHPVIAAVVNLIAWPLYSPIRAMRYENGDIIAKGFHEGMRRAQEDQQVQEFKKWIKEHIENEIDK